MPIFHSIRSFLGYCNDRLLLLYSIIQQSQTPHICKYEAADKRILVANPALDTIPLLILDIMPTKFPIADPLREAIFACFAATTYLVRPDLRRQLVLVGGAASAAHSSP